MKTNKTLAFATLVLIGLMSTGCASFQTNAGKTLVTIASTVDAAMKGWAQYVVLSEGKVPQEEIDKVKIAKMKYEACMTTALAAYDAMAKTGDQTAWKQALAVLEASQGTLLQLLTAFTRPEQTVIDEPGPSITITNTRALEPAK